MKAERYDLYREFFQPNLTQHVIPVYQRNYDWKIENCAKLFDDILEALNKKGRNTSHFVGTIVRFQSLKEKGVLPYIIIDGQQRLMTIYLLLKAIYDVAENGDTKKYLSRDLYNDFEDDPTPRTDQEKVKLKANVQDNVQLMLLMTDKVDAMNKGSSVYINYDYFLNRIRKLIERGMYQARELKEGVKRLITVVIDLQDGDDPQSVFESINSTGLRLELDDLIRNFLLMLEEKQESLFLNYWADIEGYIPKEERPQFFINFLRAYWGLDPSAKVAYQEFKNRAWPDVTKKKQSEEILKKLKKVAKYYSAFLDESKDYSDETNALLDGLRRAKQTTPFCFLMLVFEDHEDGVIDEKTLNKVLSLILNYSIRRIVCEVQSNTLKGLYQSLYERAFKNPEMKNVDYYDAIVYVLVHLVRNSKDLFPSKDLFVKGLCNTKLYRNGKLCKYLLGKLENHKNNEPINVDSDNITIEHVMPQNSANAEWRNHIGEEYDRIYNMYLDTLGNLTLTGYNEILSDDAYDRKQKKLIACNTRIKFLNEEIFNSKVWNDEVILSRAERLSKIMLEIYPDPVWSGTDYYPMTVTILTAVTLHNPSDGKGKKAVRYEFLGHGNDVNTFVDVLMGIVETLYSIDEQILQDLAQGILFFPQSRGRPYFSYSEEKLLKARKMKNSDIFVETNMSYADISWMITNLLKMYDIDESEYTLYCRKRGKSDSDD